jgi:hypothetical protein
MVPLIAFICVLEPVRRTSEKKIVNRKTKDFSLSSVWSSIFHTNFHSTTVSGSESVSESELFFRIRIQIQPKLSDSDLQQCAAVRHIRCSSRYATHDGYPRSQRTASAFYSVTLSMTTDVIIVCVTQLGGYRSKARNSVTQ